MKKFAIILCCCVCIATLLVFAFRRAFALHSSINQSIAKLESIGGSIGTDYLPLQGPDTITFSVGVPLSLGGDKPPRRFTSKQLQVVEEVVDGLPNFTHLHRVTVAGTNVPEATLVKLVSTVDFAEFVAQDTAVSDSVLRSLIQSNPDVRLLAVDRTAVTFKGLRNLQQAPQLRYLSIGGLGLSKSEIETLRKLLPDTDIVVRDLGPKPAGD